MVGRSKRDTGSKEDSNDEQEFVSLSSISNKRKKGKNSSQEDEDDDILDGFDVEGLTDGEKEDLKKVVLESRRQIPHQCVDPVEEKSSSLSPVQDNEPKSPHDIYANDDDDDDETQPPEDIDVDFELGESTLADFDENTEEMIIEDRVESPVNDVNPNTYSNKCKDRQYRTSQSSDPIDEVEAQIDSGEESEMSPTTALNSQKLNKRDDLSQEFKSIKKSNSQTSAAGSSHSEDESKIGYVHVPLRRHYRAVSTQTMKNNDCFYTRDNTTSQSSVKAIIQLFEIFRMKLKAAQSECRDKMPWGTPVKPGSHQSRTIDIKRRGQDSFYIELSEDENEEVEVIPESTKSRKTKRGSQSQTNSDEDLPELLVEESNTSETQRARSSRKKDWSKTMDTQSQAYETQQNDLNKDTDADFQELKQKNNDRSRLRAAEIDTDDFYNHVYETSDRKKRRLSRADKKKIKVLVEETQEEDLDFDQDLIKSKEKADITVSETQIDDGEDCFEVGKTELEGKRKEFSAKKIPYNSKHEKKIDEVGEIRDNSEKDPLVVVDMLDEETVGRRDEDKDIEIKKVINPMKRKKRKAKKVLVEETPDIDADDDACKIDNKRAKRRCFKLDSSSEDESIAETQEKDELSQSGQENDRCGIVDLVGEDNETDDSDKEKRKNTDIQTSLNTNSQSPIIKKSKKQCASNSKKGYSASVGLGKGSEINTDSLKELPCEKKYRSVEGNRTNARKGRMLKDSAQDSVDTSKADIPKGVKNLFNRPLSKESIDSNVSDDLSTTSSQRSSMILDEQGDLYSTQFCEIKGRKSKRIVPSKASKSNITTQKDDLLEEVLNLEDSSDVDLSKHKRDRCDANIVTKKTQRSNTRTYSKKNPKVEKISNFFDKKVEGASSRMPIDLDSDSDGDSNGMERNELSQKSNQAVPGFSCSKRVKSETNTCNKRIRVALQDIATVQKVKQMEEATNQTNKGKTIRIISKTKTVNKKQIDDTDGDKFEDNNHSSDSVMNEFDENPVSEVIKGRNIKEKRRAKGNVKQMETSVENVNDNCEDVLQRSGVFREDAGDVVEPQGQRRKQQHTEDEEEAQSTSKIIELRTTVCPICDRPFPNDIIVAHAADCNGTVQDDEKEFDALKQLSDTGQDGETTICWICECSIMEEFDSHVKKCYLEATKQQREIEEQGYRDTQQEQKSDESSPARATRGRLRNQQEGGDMLSPKMNKVKVAISKQNVKENIEREGRGVPTTREGRSAKKTKPEQTITYRAAMDDRYNSGTIKVLDSSDSTDGSSWDSGSSTDSSDDDNIPLSSVVRPGSSALISGPWNKQSNQSNNQNQSKKCNGIPDWVKDGINSPIKSFVPISQQEDSEYFQNQFRYKQKNVEKRMQKRKRTTGTKRRRKRRKVRRSKN